MAKKRNMENTNELEITEEVTEVAPITETKIISTLKVGKMRIKSKTKGGVIIIAKSQYGQLYKESEWEVVEESKKK